MLENNLKNSRGASKIKSQEFIPVSREDECAFFGDRQSSFKDILEKSKRGDKDAFLALYRDYFNPLYNYVYLRIGDKAESDDLIQDVFIKAYNSFDDSVSARESEKIYLYSTVRKMVSDWKRKRRHTVLSDENMSNHSDIGSGGEKYQEKEGFENLRKAIKRIPDEEQDAVIFRFMQDLSNEEVSAIMNKSESDIYQILSKGICSIRDNLKKQYDE